MKFIFSSVSYNFNFIEKTQTDLEFQKNMTSIQNEQMKFSENYLKYKAIDALTTNLELVLGP